MELLHYEIVKANNPEDDFLQGKGLAGIGFYLKTWQPMLRNKTLRLELTCLTATRAHLNSGVLDILFDKYLTATVIPLQCFYNGRELRLVLTGQYHVPSRQSN